MCATRLSCAANTVVFYICYRGAKRIKCLLLAVLCMCVYQPFLTSQVIIQSACDMHVAMVRI